MPKKRKRITAENLYRPQKFTLRTYTRFINQFIDRFNWGAINQNREKSFRFSSTAIENSQYKSYLRLREKPQSNPRYRDVTISDHLISRQEPDCFVFYTANVFSDLCFICGDIDPAEGYGFEECLEAFYYIEKYYFPGCYWEPSTSCRGIHFYIILDFSTFPRNYDLFHRSRCNDIIDKLSHLFSTLINSMFYCKFDKFCGTYPVYSLPFSSFKFINRGCLAKLPLPSSQSDFVKLVHTPIISYNQLSIIWKNIGQLLCPDKYISGGEKETIVSSITSNTAEQENIITLSPNSLCRASQFRSKNEDYLNSPSAWERTLHSVMKLTRELGRIPDFQEWNKYYESNKWNTGEETEHRHNRFNNAVHLIEKSFDPSKIGHIYQVGEFLDDLKRDISPKKLKWIVREKTEYRFTITYEDLDVGLGSHWTMTRKNQRPGKEMTVPIEGVVNFFKSLKKKGEFNRSCDRDKARAIRIVLQQIGYIYCIDDYYSHKRGDHTGQRWGMGEKFPKYDDYLLFCGDAEKRAKNIKKLRDEGKGDEVKSSQFLPPVYREMLE